MQSTPMGLRLVHHSSRRRTSAVPAALAALLLGACAPRPGNESGGRESQEGATAVGELDAVAFARRHCVTCHRAGGIAPFPLEEHQQLARRADQLIEVVESGYMPPWKPASDFAGRFVGDRSLTGDERDLLRRWREVGMPESGDAGEGQSGSPGPDGEWQLGEPDLVLTLEQAYELRPAGPDEVRNFLLPIPQLAGRYVAALEFDPGVRSVVHHANVLADSTGTAREYDRRTPEPGYTGMVGAVAPGGHFLGWTPGKTARRLEGDAAWQVEPGTDLVVQLHLQPSGRPESVRPRVGIFLTDRAPARTPVVLHLGSTAIDLPAGAAATTVADSFQLPWDVDLVSLYPHAHFRGSAVRVWVEGPGEQPSEELLRIDDWDFDWQDEYTLTEPLRLARGTTLHFEATFDNSADNVRNPDTPPRRVLWGPSSTDEMADVWLKVFPAHTAEAPALRRAAARKDLEIAIDGFRKRQELEPDLPEWRERLALTLLQLGRGEEAEPLLVDALERFPDDPGLLYHLGLARTASRDYGAAEQTFRAVLRSQPDHDGSVDSLAALLLARGDAAAARDLLEGRLGRAAACEQPDRQLNLALALQRLGDDDRAEALLSDCVLRAPADDRLYNQLGSIALRRGEVDTAREQFEQARRLAPERTEALRNLASLAGASGDLDTAMEHLEQAIEREPDDPGLRGLLARAHGESGDPARAVALLEEAARGNPRHGPTQFDLAAWRSEVGDAPGALDAARRAAELMPQDADAIEQMLILTAQGDGPERALSMIEGFTPLPASPTLWWTEVQLLATVGRLGEASTKLRQLTERFPTMAQQPQVAQLMQALDR